MMRKRFAVIAKGNVHATSKIFRWNRIERKQGRVTERSRTRRERKKGKEENSFHGKRLCLLDLPANGCPRFFRYTMVTRLNSKESRSERARNENTHLQLSNALSYEKNSSVASLRPPAALSRITRPVCSGLGGRFDRNTQSTTPHAS